MNIVWLSIDEISQCHISQFRAEMSFSCLAWPFSPVNDLSIYSYNTSIDLGLYFLAFLFHRWNRAHCLNFVLCPFVWSVASTFPLLINDLNFVWLSTRTVISDRFLNFSLLIWTIERPIEFCSHIPAKLLTWANVWILIDELNCNSCSTIGRLNFAPVIL